MGLRGVESHQVLYAPASASVEFSVSFYSHIYAFHIFPTSCKPRGPSWFQSMVMVAALSQVQVQYLFNSIVKNSNIKILLLHKYY